ncbi:glycoside hydrolase family 51 protein [Mycena floridula]|nr:glycoside hydrolase family 51 protein [Mycena floridula]
MYSLLFFAAAVLPPALAQVTVSVSATASHAIPTTLCESYFLLSGDGGLYAELLQNRAFQKVTPNTAVALNAWTSISGTPISVIADPSPVSSALPNSLQLVVPANSASPASFGNTGFWGIQVLEQTNYNASFYFRLAKTQNLKSPITLTVSLVSSKNVTLASSRTSISPQQTSWKQFKTVLRPTISAPDTQNKFVVTVQVANAPVDVAINFAMFSLFPPTFKDRENGMRKDLAETLFEMKPAFFRFVGGNNLEGQTIDTRWQWNATVGPLVDRPGRVGDWGYVNTDGLGLLEYLYWCEDAEMEPFMAIWSGYSLGGASVTGDALAPYIQQAIDQINFVIGDPAKSAPAALRASLGRSEPFALTYVEVGNEDFIGQAPATYQDRWNRIVTNLTATFPQLKFMATSHQTGSVGPVLTPKPTQYDIHVYQTPTWFYQNSFVYDTFPRDGTTYFEGEYAAISTNSSNIFGTPDQGRLLWPTVQSAVGESSFMTGLERNADIVFAAAYAPLLQHINSTQWTPDLVSFDAGTLYKSTSFYVQKLFSLNRGDVYLPSTLSSSTGTLFWSVTRVNATGDIIIKVSNNSPNATAVTFSLPFTIAPQGKLTLLTGAPGASNNPATPNAVSPVDSVINTGSTFVYQAPGFSVGILTLGVEA